MKYLFIFLMQPVGFAHRLLCALRWASPSGVHRTQLGCFAAQLCMHTASGLRPLAVCSYKGRGFAPPLIGPVPLRGTGPRTCPAGLRPAGHVYAAIGLRPMAAYVHRSGPRRGPLLCIHGQGPKGPARVRMYERAPKGPAHTCSGAGPRRGPAPRTGARCPKGTGHPYTCGQPEGLPACTLGQWPSIHSANGRVRGPPKVGPTCPRCPKGTGDMYVQPSGAKPRWAAYPPGEARRVRGAGRSPAPVVQPGGAGLHI